MITRRCSERRFFMRPDRETNNAFIYCLALAARKASVSIVCVGTTSNHWHGIVVDKLGWIVILSAIFLHLKKTPITEILSPTHTYTPKLSPLYPDNYFHPPTILLRHRLAPHALRRRRAMPLPRGFLRVNQG
jgi:hypothetical protein